MPRNYLRKTNKGSWTPEQLAGALSDIQQKKMSIREAGRVYEIPESTIRKKMKIGNPTKLKEEPHLGKFPTFTKEQEKELVEHVLKLGKNFYGLTTIQLRKLAFDYAEANNIKHNFNKTRKLAGKDWYYSFLGRNKEISLRKPEPTSINRIKAFNEEEVQTFFKNLGELYDKYRFTSDKIFNVDESGITTVQKPGKCLGPKGIKQFGSITSGERGKTVTIICCCSASGNFVAPMFIYPRKRMSPNLEKKGPEGSIYNCSPSGWSNEVLFCEWLKHFVKTIKPSVNDPVLVILDNHSSHISLDIYNFCKNNGIVLLTLPPHTSHRFQPLDLTFFGPLKTQYNSECDTYLKRFERITIYELAELFNNAYIKKATMEKAISGFNKAGIYPYQPNKFTAEAFAPASSFNPVLDDSGLEESISVEGSSSSRQNVPKKSLSSLPSTSTCTPQSATLPSNFLPEPQASCSNAVERCIPESSSCQQSASAVNRQKATAFVSPESHPSCSKITKTPHVTAESLSPLPVHTKKTSTIKRTKQKSKVLTATPNKEELIEAERKRHQRKVALEKNSNQKKTKKKRPSTKRKVFESENADDDNDMDTMNSDDDEDDGVPDKDECIVCGDFSRKNELWFRYTECSGWAHSLCTGWDTPENYVCDLCDN